MRGSVEELLDIATDSFEDGERCPNACVAISKALRLALGRDRVEDAVARAVGKVVLAEYSGIVSLGVGQRELRDLVAIGGEQLTIFTVHADDGIDEGLTQLLDLVVREALLEPFLDGLVVAIEMVRKRLMVYSYAGRGY